MSIWTLGTASDSGYIRIQTADHADFRYVDYLPYRIKFWWHPITLKSLIIFNISNPFLLDLNNLKVT